MDFEEAGPWIAVTPRNPGRSIGEWREARGLSVEDLAYRIGTDEHTMRHWEYRGYDPTAQCGLALAEALDTPVDTIIFGRFLRGLALPGYEFILGARGRDDLGWRARIVEWRGEGNGETWFSTRADAGWLEVGPSARIALDRLERGIRAALDPTSDHASLAMDTAPVGAGFRDTPWV